MNADKAQTIATAIMAAIIVERIQDANLRTYQICIEFLSKIRKETNGSFDNPFPDDLADQVGTEKWIDAWGKRVLGFVIENGLDLDGTILKLAQTVLSEWKEYSSTHYSSDLVSNASLLPGDSTTDAPPPRQKK